MNNYEYEEIQKMRNYYVIKGNELIQKNRFNLSLPEQKTVAYICSMIKPVDDNHLSFQLEYDFNIRDYCKVCGINYDSGTNYSDVKETLKKLSDRSMWIDFGESESLCRWLAKVKFNKRNSIAHITIDNDLAPYLFNLKEQFTKYQLYNVLAMKSAYSIHIYELIKSYAFQRRKTFELDNLKKLLGVENIKSYERYADFRCKVLKVAKKEINKLTDINFDYEPIKKGNKVVKLIIFVRPKEPIEIEIATNEVYKELDEKKNKKKRRLKENDDTDK